MRKSMIILLVSVVVFSTTLVVYAPRTKAALPLLAPIIIEKTLEAIITGITVGVGLKLAGETGNMLDTYDAINTNVPVVCKELITTVPAGIKAEVESAIQTKIATNSDYIVVDDSIIAWANSYVTSRVIATMIGGMELTDTGQGVLVIDENTKYAPLLDTTMEIKWRLGNYYTNYIELGTFLPSQTEVNSSNLSHVFIDDKLNFIPSILLNNEGYTDGSRGVRAKRGIYYDGTKNVITTTDKRIGKSYLFQWLDTDTYTRGNDALLDASKIIALAKADLKIITYEQLLEIQAKQRSNELTIPTTIDTVKIPMVLTPTADGYGDVSIPVPQVVEGDDGKPKVAVPLAPTLDGTWDWTGELVDPITGETVREGERTDIENPPIEWDDTPYVPPVDLPNRWGQLVTTRFPFSLPWDVYHLIGLINVPPVRPEITINEEVGGLNFDLNHDFVWLDDYIGYFRTFIVIGFVMALILATRRLLGGAQ